MVAYERSDAVLALGKKLVAELKLGDTTDTLARWIIHYIAELIKKVERSTAKRKEKLARECFEAILVLWQHRHEMPDGKRPFEGLENFNTFSKIRTTLEASGCGVLREKGLHLFPFQLRLPRISKWCDEHLQSLRVLMINLCVLARKR